MRPYHKSVMSHLKMFWLLQSHDSGYKTSKSRAFKRHNYRKKERRIYKKELFKI